MKLDEAWRTYRAELLGFVLKRVGDKALAEDIVHDVFVKALERMASLQDPAKLRPWLFQITRNAVVDHFRARRPHDPLPEDMAGEEGPAGGEAERELARCLTPLIEAMPEPYRRALTAAEFEGRTQREIASREKLSLPGAKSRVQRARKLLRESLVACCRVELDRGGGISDHKAAGECGC